MGLKLYLTTGLTAVFSQDRRSIRRLLTIRVMRRSMWEDMPVENDLSHWVWTYTFTNADYDAAVARGPMTEQ